MDAGNQEFQIVKVFGLPIFKYEGANTGHIVADLYLTQDILGRLEGEYAQAVPRFRANWPTPQEFANESLDGILSMAWPGGVPSDAQSLLSAERTCVFDSHGNHYEEGGWGAHIGSDVIIPIPALLDYFHSSGYCAVLITTCNPEKMHLEPRIGSVIYPIGLFGRATGKFKMIVRKAPTAIVF